MAIEMESAISGPIKLLLEVYKKIAAMNYIEELADV